MKRSTQENKRRNVKETAEATETAFENKTNRECVLSQRNWSRCRCVVECYCREGCLDKEIREVRSRTLCLQ